MNQKLITGLFVSNQSDAEWFYNENRERFPNSIHNLGTGELWYHWEHKELPIKYVGETLGTLDKSQGNKLYWDTCDVNANIFRHNNNLIIDETELYYLILAQKESLNNKFRVSLSSYRNVLFSFPIPKFLQSLFGLNRLRIYGWKSHLSELKKVDVQFKARHKNMNIHLYSSRKHFAELIKYGIETGKTIMLYAGDNYEYDYVSFFDELENQLKNSRLSKTTTGTWL